jgi:hypothetical protein
VGGEGALASCVGIWAEREHELAAHSAQAQHAAEEGVMVFGKSRSHAVPIVVRQQVIAQQADVAQRPRQAFAPGRVRRPGGVADQNDAISIGVLHPAGGAIEGRERPRQLYLLEPARGRARGAQVFDGVSQIACARQSPG